MPISSRLSAGMACAIATLAIGFVTGANASGDATASRVIPKGSEDTLRDLLEPLLGAPPPLSVTDVSVRVAAIHLSLDIDRAEAEVVIRHGDQHQGSSSAHRLSRARLSVETSCPGCTEDNLAILHASLATLNHEGWGELWKERTPSKTTAADTPARDELRARFGGPGFFLAVLTALLVAGLLIVDAKRNGPARIPFDQPCPDTRGPWSGPLRWYDLFVVGIAVVAVARPFLHEPFEDGAPVHRLFMLIDWPMNDPGHPPLPFWFIRPFAAVSLEPWVVRLPLLGFLVAHTLVLTAVCAKVAGRWAGFLGAAWMISEIGRRYGLNDVSGWDLAGAFAVTLLLWLLVAEKKGLRRRPLLWAGLALIIVAGTYSSWFFVIPASIAVLCVFLLAAGGRADWAGLPVMLLLLAVLGLRILSTFTDHGEPSSFVESAQLLPSLVNHTPLGRSYWLLVPLTAGLVRLSMEYRRGSTRYASATYLLSTIPMVGLATVVMSLSRWVSGYYMNLVTGLIIVVAVLGTASVIARFERFVRGISASVPSLKERAAPLGGIFGAVALLALTALTVRPPLSPSFETDNGFEKLYEFDLVTRESTWPIAHRFYNLEMFIAYQRALASEGWSDEAVIELADRTFEFDPTSCSVAREPPEAPAERSRWREPPLPPPPGYFVFLKAGEGDPCRERLRRDCEMLLDESSSYNYFACDASMVDAAASPPVSRGRD